LTLDPLQVVSPIGKLNKNLEPKIQNDRLLHAYKIMTLTRFLDAKALNMQRQGKLSTYTSCAGHEATQVGSTFALDDEGVRDWIFPMYRDLGVMLARGVSLQEVFDRFLGNSRDAMKGRDLPNLYSWKKYKVVSSAAPIASGIPVSVGFAMAARLKKDPVIAATYFGDGATSSGEFHVGLNFAGVYKAPCVFICENNQYAISVPLKGQTASKDIATKSVAYGIGGVKVDGNDLLAVYLAVSEAKKRALSGYGPTLIECVTYRLESHSTADDQKRYRDQQEVEEWKAKDPLKRFRAYLEEKGLWNQNKEEALSEEIQNEIDGALREAERVEQPSPRSLITDVYETSPTNLQEQFRTFGMEDGE
jgi:pyruvate dehydrogenase E1 component alpha subunit